MKNRIDNSEQIDESIFGSTGLAGHIASAVYGYAKPNDEYDPDLKMHIPSDSQPTRKHHANSAAVIEHILTSISTHPKKKQELAEKLATHRKLAGITEEQVFSHEMDEILDEWLGFGKKEPTHPQLGVDDTKHNQMSDEEKVNHYKGLQNIGAKKGGTKILTQHFSKNPEQKAAYSKYNSENPRSLTGKVSAQDKDKITQVDAPGDWNKSKLKPNESVELLKKFLAYGDKVISENSKELQMDPSGKRPLMDVSHLSLGDQYRHHIAAVRFYSGSDPDKIHPDEYDARIEKFHHHKKQIGELESKIQFEDPSRPTGGSNKISRDSNPENADLHIAYYQNYLEPLKKLNSKLKKIVDSSKGTAAHAITLKKNEDGIARLNNEINFWKEKQK